MEYLAIILLVIILIQLSGISGRLTRLEKLVPNENPAPPPAPPPPVQTPSVSVPEKRAPARPPSAFEKRSREILVRIWNWLCVGNDQKDPAVSREYAASTTWLIRLGVVILLCGIGFFLKYSIDRNWTPPLVRVSGMAILGVVLACAGTWKSNGKYRPLAIGLAGTGIVTLYLSIMTAYKMYHLLPAPGAFAAVIAVTAGSMACSLFSRALLPVLLGSAGGYLAPVFIDTGSHNILALFIYLAVLNSGTLLLALFKNWPLLNGAGFLFYAFVGGSAFALHFPAKEAVLPLLGLLCFNYLIFEGVIFLASGKKDASLLETLQSGANLIFYLALSIPAAEKFYSTLHLPALCAVFAAAAAGAGWLFIAKRAAAPVPVLSHLAQIKLCTAAALVVPLLLKDVWIAAAWSVMACMLAITAARLKERTFLFMSSLLFLFTFGWIVVDVFMLDNIPADYPAALQVRLLTCGVYVLALFFAGCRNTKVFPQAGGVMCSTAGGLFWICSSYEVYEMLNACVKAFRHGGLSVYWSVFAFILLYRGIKKRNKALRLLSLLLFLLAAFKIFFIDMAHLEQIWRIVACAAIGIFMLTGAVLYIKFKELLSEKE